MLLYYTCKRKKKNTKKKKKKEQIAPVGLVSLSWNKTERVYFVSGPNQGLEMETAVLHRVGFLEYFCPKQGEDFKPSAAPLYPNLGQVPPSPPPRGEALKWEANWFVFWPEYLCTRQ